MTREGWRPWVEVAKALAGDSKAEVLCPTCRAAALRVEDVHFGEREEHLERWVTCPACGRREAILMRWQGPGARGDRPNQ